MKLLIPAIAVMLALAIGAAAQAPDAAIEKALLAAPAQMKAGATVVQWKSDFTYDTLRKGTNRLVCYVRPERNNTPAFSTECTSIANLDRVAQSLKLESTTDTKDRQAAFEALERAGKWTKPEYGSIFYNYSGADQATARSHATIAVPGATMQTLGLPETGAQGGAWIMNAGSTAAHLMMPGH